MEAGRRLAAGREAEVFLQPDGTVLKLLRERASDEPVRREAAALAVLGAAGIGAPTPLGTTTVDGRPGLLMERVEGADLLTRVGRNPLRALTGGRTMARVHAAMHDVPAPAELPAVRDVLRARIEVAPPLTEGLRARALALVDALPDGDRLLHGDLHLGNLIGGWDEPAVIDWGGASRGDPLADVGQTALLHRLASPPPGAPPVVRVLAPIGSRVLRRGYLAAYRRLRGLDREAVDRWEVAQAAARLAVGIDEEEHGLLALVRSRLP